MKLKQVIDEHRSTHPRHHDIGQDEVRPFGHLLKSLNGLGRIPRRDDPVSSVGKNRFDQSKNVRLIVDNKNGPNIFG